MVPVLSMSVMDFQKNWIGGLSPVFLGEFFNLFNPAKPLTSIKNNRGIDCSVRYHLVTSCVVQSRCCHCHIIVFPDKVSECHKDVLEKYTGQITLSAPCELLMKL